MTLNFREDDEQNLSDKVSETFISEKSIIDQHLAIDDEIESSNSEEIDDDEESEDENNIEPTLGITKHDFASSPWSMMGAVGGAFFLVFGGGYLFLNSVFNGNSTTVAENKEIEVEEETKVVEKSHGDVYAKLALKQQQDELAKLNDIQEIDDEEVTEEVKKPSEDKTVTKPAPKTVTKPQLTPHKVVRSTPKTPPQRRTTPQRRATLTRRTTPRRSVTPRPQPKPVRRDTSQPKGVNKIARTISRPPQIERDPLAELNRLRTIGSFGKINYVQANYKNNSGVKETLVASASPMYETPRQRRLRRRREMQIENVASTSINTNFQTIRTNNTIEKITPKWEPVFDTEEVEFTPDISPENQPHLIASSSPNIHINTNYSPQLPIEEKPNFIEKIKQTKIRQNKNNYYASQTNKAQDNSSSFIDSIKQAKIGQNNNNYYSSQGIYLNPNSFIETIKRAKSQAKQIKNSYSFQLASNQEYLAQEERFLEAIKPKYLMVGEYASGHLLTPISQRQTEEHNSDSKRFVAKLTQDIRDNRGAIAIPKGTLLAVKITSVDGASIASVEVTSIIKNQTEYPLPPGTISVYGKNGTPLIAKQFKDKGREIARYDTTVAVMGGLAKVGEIINQPEDEETIEDPTSGRIRNTRRNSRRSIGGAILEGAFGELTDTVKKRAETSTQEIMSRPNTWFIPAKTKLTFIINRSIQLPSRL